MKVIKFIFKAILWIVVLVVIALLALPLWIGPVVKGVANSVVPGITGTGFNLGEFGLNPYVGTLHVGDMQLANPTNFSEKNAVALDKFDADIAVTSLFGGKKICIESVDLDGLVVYTDPKMANFRQIAANAAGEPEEKSEAAKLAEENAPAEEPKAEANLDKWSQMDQRVRYGAYRIVGTDKVVKVKEGDNIVKISRRILGPDMECYIEVFNNMKASTPLKVGQEIKIPKLELKKKKKAATAN